MKVKALYGSLSPGMGGKGFCLCREDPVGPAAVVAQSDRVDGCGTDETSIWRNAGRDLADDPIE